MSKMPKETFKAKRFRPTPPATHSELIRGVDRRKVESEQRWVNAEKYRQATARLFLTLGHRLPAVTRKQEELTRGEHKHTDLSSERIDAAIAKDHLAILAVHRMRRKREKSTARCRGALLTGITIGSGQ